MLKITQRYVLFEVIKVFLVALIVLVGIFLLAGALQFVRRGISLGEFVRVIPFASITTFAYTIPVALIVGVALGYGKMVDENEVVSMRASGISLISVTLPVYILALFLSAFAYLLTSEIVPDALYRRSMVVKPYAERLLSLTEGSNESFELRDYNPFGERKDTLNIFCRSYSGRKLSGLVIRNTDKVRPLEILAASGEIFFLPEENLLLIELHDVTITLYGTDSRQSCDLLTCDRFTIEVPVVSSPGDRPKFFSSARLFKMMSAEKSQIRAISETLSSQTLTEQDAQNLAHKRIWHRERRQYISQELFTRFALTTYPFLFALVSLPLSVLIARYGRYASFLTAILTGFIGGFLPCLFFQTLISRGFIPLWPAFAITTAILALPGFYLTRRLAQL